MKALIAGEFIIRSEHGAKGPFAVDGVKFLVAMTHGLCHASFTLPKLGPDPGTEFSYCTSTINETGIQHCGDKSECSLLKLLVPPFDP